MSRASLRYWVLEPAKYEADRVALRAYANAIRKDDPTLASDLDEWLSSIAASGKDLLTRCRESLSALS